MRRGPAVHPTHTERWRGGRGGAAGAADQPNEKIVAAVMGVRNRGKDLVGAFSAMKDVEIACLCEVDENVVPAAQKVLAGRQRRAARVEKDIRRVLDDKSINAVIIAAPDH